MRHVTKVLASLSIGLPLLVWTAAATSEPVAAATAFVNAPPLVVQQAAPDDPYASMPNEPAKAIVIKTCTKCHSITNITGNHKSRAAWEETVNKMVGYGASGSDDEFMAILDYVTKYYGVDSPPAASK